MVKPLLANVTAWLLVVVPFAFKYTFFVVFAVLHPLFPFPAYVIVNVLLYAL